MWFLNWLKAIWKEFDATVEPVKPKNSILITTDQLKQIAGTMKDGFAIEMTELINELCVKYGIIDKKPFQMFLANVIQESGEFSHKEENMNYRAITMTKVWPSRFPTLASAQPYAHNPQALANNVYGGRMGNTEPNDGWTYKGGGFIGLTGKVMYSKYAKYLGKDISFAAGLVHSDNRYALDSACWFFAVHKNLIAVAQTGNFKAVVRGINGGLTGLATRQHYYDLCKKVLG